MTDENPTPDPDDLLRRALHAEAEGVVANDALLDRTITATSRPPVRAGRRLLLTAAVAAAVAIGAAVAIAQDDDSKVDSAGDPSSTTTEVEPDLSSWLPPLVECEDGETVDVAVYVSSGATPDEVQAIGDAGGQDIRVRAARHLDTAQVAAASIAYQEGAHPENAPGTPPPGLPSAWLFDVIDATDETGVRALLADLPEVYGISDVGCSTSGAPVDGTRPTLIALLREDGMLMVVDLKTGDQRELYSAGSPQEMYDPDIDPSFIDAVDLDPDGAWVYFSVCCDTEHALGRSYRIPVRGGEPELIADGVDPQVSPDGRWLATVGRMHDGLFITPLAGGGSASIAPQATLDAPAWSPDSRQLAALAYMGDRGVVAHVNLFSWDGEGLAPLESGIPDQEIDDVQWSPEGVLTTVLDDGEAGYRDSSQDRSYEWILWVGTDHVVRVQEGFGSGDRSPITRLPPALAADW